VSGVYGNRGLDRRGDGLDGRHLRTVREQAPR
jgi:hypothetical protein